MRYIALLRGINVGGNTIIRMTDLKELFGSLGFEDVATYINSGNVAFDVKKTPEDKLSAKIEKAIEKRLGKNIQVMIREQAAIGKILENNPFEGNFGSHKEMHVLFMRSGIEAETEKLLLQQQTDNEQFEVRGREIYTHLKAGFADSLLGKGYIEKKLKVPITARNWRTVEKLATI